MSARTRTPALPREGGADRLSDLKVGSRGTISALDRDDPDRLRKLLALGILPGVRFELLQAWPAFVIRVGRSQFAIDGALAQGIRVASE